MEYTQKQLEEMVVGKPSRPRALFFEKAALNVAESKAQGRRVYDRKVYVRKMQPGVRDSISYLAQKADIVEFRAEYEEFLRNRQGAQTTVSISVIPNLDLSHMQELVDMGLGTVQALAESEVVPKHLEYARQSAIALDAVLKEQRHGKEESNQEIHKHGTGLEGNPEAEVRSANEVPAVGGQEHLHRERQHEPAASRVDGDAEDSRRLRPGRQEHHRPQELDNWSVTFQLMA